MDHYVSRKRLKKLLDYCPEAGIFRWITKPNRNIKIGVIAGSNSHGYISIRIDGRNHLAHRLAFLYLTGAIPIQVDHINHIRNDNRWINLRPANYQINGKNLSINRRNKTGVTGVYQDERRGNWYAHIGHNGTTKYLGRFNEKQDAINARKKALIELNYHHNHGK